MSKGCYELVLALTGWHPCPALTEVTLCTTTRYSFQEGRQTEAETALPGSPHEQDLSLFIINTLSRKLIGEEEVAVPSLERGCLMDQFPVRIRYRSWFRLFPKVWFSQRQDFGIDSS